GQWLELGKTYQLIARPGPGCLFSNWTGGVASDCRVLGNSPTLTFVMQSNLAVRANFVPNPFGRMAGSFAGLFYAPGGLTLSNAGYFSATLTPGGAFTARVQHQTKSYALSGQLAVDGSWHTPSISGAPGLSAHLQLDLQQGERLTGWLSNEWWTADLQAYRGATSKSAPAPQVGQYTLVIPGSDSPAALPGGHGALAVNVSASGAVTVSGTLGDGEPFAASTLVSRQGQWPLFGTPYGKAGLLLGWLSFTPDPADPVALSGTVAWLKPGQIQTKLYPNGFTWPCQEGYPNAFGSAFTNRVTLLNCTNGVVVLEAGNLPQSQTNGFTFGPANQVRTANGLKLTFTNTGLKAGLFSGSMFVGSEGKSAKFNGALLQNRNCGYGWFAGTNQSGRVRLSASPIP
ncbi:MAG TPA: hypothetical protein VNT26_16430, partial [Candidatus Sulfotelmatobacter sp.]|nr:hypothetical protein [Candidatus Sulfotelmatobacter sp.]